MVAVFEPHRQEELPLVDGKRTDGRKKDGKHRSLVVTTGQHRSLRNGP